MHTLFHYIVIQFLLREKNNNKLDMITLRLHWCLCEEESAYILFMGAYQ